MHSQNHDNRHAKRDDNNIIYPAERSKSKIYSTVVMVDGQYLTDRFMKLNFSLWSFGAMNVSIHGTEERSPATGRVIFIGVDISVVSLHLCARTVETTRITSIQLWTEVSMIMLLCFKVAFCCVESSPFKYVGWYSFI